MATLFGFGRDELAAGPPVRGLLRMMMVAGLALMLGIGFAGRDAMAASGDSGQPAVSDEDPYEGFNRTMFAIHEGIDVVVLQPVSTVYNTVLPVFVRDAVANVLANVSTPIIMVNDLLQGEPDRARIAFERFMINSTAGLGGIVDVAAAGGLEPHYEDFGQTLAVGGVDSGPYIFLPILGPGTPRHLVGRAFDALLSPWTWIFYGAPVEQALSPAASTLVSARAKNDLTLSTLKETSPDYYASIRSLYLQSRRYEIANGEESFDDLPDIPDVER